jgi:aminoglycoside 6-adenylyltransferase
MVPVSEKTRSVEKLLERFVGWARIQPDVIAVLNQGSRARTDHPADQWADLDLIIFTTDKEKYLNSAQWLDNFGKIILTYLEQTAVGDELERRALFEGGVDVDFSIISKEQLAENVDHPNSQDLDMVRRGVRVLLDKSGTIEAGFSKLSKLPRPERSPPSREEFGELVNDFLYHVYWTAKKLRRGELWTAKGCCDGYMKRKLLTMIEWNTLETKGWDTDVWFNGRYLEEWAEPETLNDLMEAFAHYEREDIEHALFATTNLFLRLTRATAEKLGFDSSLRQVEPVLDLARSSLIH